MPIGKLEADLHTSTQWPDSENLRKGHADPQKEGLHPPRARILKQSGSQCQPYIVILQRSVALSDEFFPLLLQDGVLRGTEVCGRSLVEAGGEALEVRSSDANPTGC